MSTNALHHGLRAGSYAPAVPAELWIWARVTPAPQLVVTVFDTCRSSWPDTTPRDLLDEHGKGVGIVGVVADAWGAHLSRSRLDPGRAPGKAVWSAFTLPGPWSDAGLSVPPAIAARHLAATLAARGIDNVGHRHEHGVSLVSVPLAGHSALNVWVEPRSLAFTDPAGTRVRRPLVDLQDLAEHLVRRTEESREGR
ncbi:MAG TPA: hypothetical protein VGP70_12535 [Actinomadura sp.]|jgi:hypothetical protein|nr:hypothetical protein [Actinomadura sp.]